MAVTCESANFLFILTPQLYSEIFDPRKKNANFLEVNFECFRLLTACNGENNRTAYALF